MMKIIDGSVGFLKKSLWSDNQRNAQIETYWIIVGFIIEIILFYNYIDFHLTFPT